MHELFIIFSSDFLTMQGDEIRWMTTDELETNKQTSSRVLSFEIVFFVFSFPQIMSTNGPGLTQQATNLFQTASTQIKNLLSSDGPMKKKTDQCLIYEKPSTMDDTNDCVLADNSKQSDSLFKHQPDLCEDDQFRACFLDCACQCSVRASRSSWFSSLVMILVLSSRQKRSLKEELCQHLI